MLEIPPLTWGGALRLPAGGWCGRAAAPTWILSAARSQLRRGGLPLLVVHPWELTGRAVPGFLSGFARFFHEAGREVFHERFRTTLAGLPWRSMASALGLGGNIGTGLDKQAKDGKTGLMAKGGENFGGD